MRSTSPLGTAQRCIATLATTGLLLAGLVAPAMAKSAPMAASMKVADPCASLTKLVTRPTLTNSVCTVAPDHQLLELGYSTTRVGGFRLSTYPQAVLRLGTTIKNLEVQIGAPSWSRVRGSVLNTPAALGDSAVGARYFLGSGKRYAHSVQYNLSLPTGDSPASLNGYNSTFAYQGSYKINSIFAATGMLRQSSLVGTGTTGNIRYGSFNPSLEISAALPKDYTLFVEGATFTRPFGQNTSSSAYQAGAKKALCNKVQIDVEYGVNNYKTIGSSTLTHSVGAGLAFYH